MCGSLYNEFFSHLQPTSSDIRSLQGDNCDSNLRLVVGEDDNGKLRLEQVNKHSI